MRKQRSRGLSPLLAMAAAIGVGADIAAAAAAADSAADPAYAAEAGGAWKGQYVTTPVNPEENPPGTDNGGTGFGVWDFSDGYHFSANSPYGTTNHFIDGVDFPASTFNDLGGPAFGLTNYNGDYGTTIATRPFAAPMSVGETFGVNFDSPAVYNTDGNHNIVFPFAIIQFNNAAGQKTFDIEAGKNDHFGEFNWRYDHAGGTNVTTGVDPDATSHGSALTVELTSETTGRLIFDLGGPDQRVIPITLLAGAPASVSFTQYSNASLDTSGEHEFFFNDLSLTPPSTNEWQKIAGSDSGNWGDLARWTGGAIPDGIDANVDLLHHDSIDGNQTVNLDLPRTAGVINFDNPVHSYTVVGSNPITLDVTSGQAQINVSSGTHAIAAPLLLSDDATITAARPSAVLTIADVQASSAKLTKAGPGNLTVTGTLAHTGGTLVNEGTLQVGNGGTSGAIAGDIEVAAGGTLAFNRSDDLAFGNVVIGSGGLTKLAGNTLTLTGNNTYAGLTTVSAGTLQLGDGGASGSIGGNVSVAGGATLKFNRSDNLTFDGAINGGGSLVKLNSNTLILTGNNTYTGGTTVSAGTLDIGNGGTSGSIAGNVSLTDPSSILRFNRSDAVTFSGAISGGGTLAKLGAGTLILTGDSTYAGATTVSEGTLQLGNGGTTGSIAGTVNVGTGATLSINRSDNLTFANVVTGSGGLTKLAGNTLTLTGENTYAGGTTVSAGTLRIGNGGTTGSVAGNVSVGGGATLSFNRSDNFTFGNAVTGAGGLTKLAGNTLTLTAEHTYPGGTTVSAGTLRIGDGGTSGSIAGNVAVGSGATLGFNRSDDVTFGGAVSGNGALAKLTGNTLTLTGSNNYNGGTTVSAGMLQIGNGATTGSISGSVSVGAGATLRFNRSDNLTFGGAISGGGGLSKLGAGTLTLTGNSTYTGGTTVSAGTLQVGNGGNTGSIAGNVSVASAAALSFNRSNAVTFGGVISGDGGLAKLAGNTLTLTGNNTYAGGTTVSAGTLQLGNGAATGSINGNVSVGGGATLSINRSDDLAFGNVVSGSGGLTKLAGNTLTLTGENTYAGVTTISAGTLRIGDGGTTGSVAGQITNNGFLTFNRSDNVTFGGAISGNGGVIKIGGNTLTLTGNNTYTGGTTVASGTLQVGNGGTTGSITGNVGVGLGGGAMLSFNRSDNVTFGGAISGIGTLSKLGAGTLTLPGTLSHTGGTVANAGTLQVRRLHQNNAVTINAGATLRVLESSPGLGSGHPSGDNAMVSRPSSLTIATGGTLDLTNNDLILDYAGASPIAEIEALVASGYNIGIGDWQGDGIVSSVAALDGNYVLAIADNATLIAPFGTAQGGSLFAGQDVDLDTILIKFTHRADINLDGLITPDDSAIFGGNYDETQLATWATGDMNYDGAFTPDDAAIFGGAYDDTLMSLPEPGLAIALLAIAPVAVSRRRR